MVWFKFVLCLVIILFAGTKLARYGDAIGEKTGLSGVWIGLLLLAAITSMPELVTGVSSVALVGLPDLAVGTLFGSCLLNLAIIGLMDIIHRPSPVLSATSPRQMVSAGWQMMFIVVAAGGILTAEWLSGLTLGWVGIPSVVILILYLLVVRHLFRVERDFQQPTASSPKYDGSTTRAVWLKFGLAAAAVIGAGIWLSLVGAEITGTYDWAEASFVGSLFLAVSTSAPELVVTITALRLGAVDMAVANILGSNMFNIAIILPVDLAYSRGSIFTGASPVHLVTAVVVVVMSLLVIGGLRFRQRRKTFFVISWYGAALIVLYLLGTYALFTLA